MKNDKHNVEEDNEAISQLPDFRVNAKEMSTFSKILNLAINKSELLQSFSYSNKYVTMKMQDGKVFSSQLKDMYVIFEKTNGVISYIINGNGKKISFYQTTNITDKEWNAINGVLCLAGTTRGRSLFSKETKYLGYINIALKAIKAIS
ncbi:MAG: hypothetical protein HDS56_07280 [Barnesiella sp.]|nr:hypothetical protein [Barnesiella sp.]MBD5344682.1 hypothetical protein [Bacteroides sp.]